MNFAHTIKSTMDGWLFSIHSGAHWLFILFLVLAVLFCRQRLSFRSHRKFSTDFAVDLTIFGLVFLGFWDLSFLKIYSPSLLSVPSYENVINHIDIKFLPLGLLSFCWVDFCFFLTHRSLHLNPYLWQFHKLHHSVEHMNPLATWRMHPLEMILIRGGAVISRLIFYVPLFHLCTPEAFLKILCWDVLVTFIMRWSNLIKHSGVCMSYPHTLSLIFQSPAMHLVHHDKREEAVNFGGTLSIWDVIWKTNLIPTKAVIQTICLGIEEGPYLSKKTIVLKLLIQPVVSLLKLEFSRPLSITSTSKDDGKDRPTKAA